jgi:hypothetical protein
MLSFCSYVLKKEKKRLVANGTSGLSMMQGNNNARTRILGQKVITFSTVGWRA